MLLKKAKKQLESNLNTFFSENYPFDRKRIENATKLLNEQRNQFERYPHVKIRKLDFHNRFIMSSEMANYFLEEKPTNRREDNLEFFGNIAIICATEYINSDANKTAFDLYDKAFDLSKQILENVSFEKSLRIKLSRSSLIHKFNLMTRQASIEDLSTAINDIYDSSSTEIGTYLDLTELYMFGFEKTQNPLIPPLAQTLLTKIEDKSTYDINRMKHINLLRETYNLPREKIDTTKTRLSS